MIFHEIGADAGLRERLGNSIPKELVGASSRVPRLHPSHREVARNSGTLLLDLLVTGQVLALSA
jgi:hypothetical protein